MKKLLLFATTMLLAFSGIKLCAAKESANANESTAEAAAVAGPMVYSNCYDGYLNVRAQPTTQSQILARLNNGPDGAELLGVEGKWSKVRVNGVVGYVSSNYLQSTPTDPVYIDASAVVGDWIGDCSGVLKVKSNGKFEHTFGFSAMSETVGGSWHLSRKSIVLKYSSGEVTVCNVNGDTMVSDSDETFSRL